MYPAPGADAWTQWKRDVFIDLPDALAREVYALARYSRASSINRKHSRPVVAASEALNTC